MGTPVGRKLGYVAATLVGLAVGGLLAFGAVAASLCQTWGEECTAEETAAMDRMWRAAVLAPAVAIGGWTVVDVAVFRPWSASRRDEQAAPEPTIGTW